MATNTNGLIYYKLDTEKYGYPGDLTKNCGLRGEEVDSNFNFLRGEDIKDIIFDVNGNLNIIKLNGEKLIAEKVLEPELPNYVFTYDEKNGELSIIAPNGEITTLTGFAPTVNIYNYHDYTLQGNGTLESPLKVNETIRTGRYKPAIRLIDVINGENLPNENVAKYERYVTKEKFSKFGKLYSLKDVELISKRLKEINSEWRIPSKNDWDKMLNTIDCFEPNHNENTSNVFLGESAGAALKATSYWKNYNDEILSDDKYGFSIYPVGYAGNRGKEYYGSFGESSAFWTITEKLDNKDMFVKLFEYNTEKVGQRIWGENYYLSLRLVKDFKENNFNNTEIIDGSIVECIQIPETDLIWTKSNIDFTKPEYEGFTPTEWEQYENDINDSIAYNIRYFVNEWDGEKWAKHELSEGDGIVLKEGKYGKSHEWIVVNGELVDISVLINSDLTDNIESLNERINIISNELTSTLEYKITELENKLLDDIQNETLKLTQSDKDILDRITEEQNRAENAERELHIFIESNTSLINNSIDELVQNYKDIENSINAAEQNAINASSAYTNKEILSLKNDIDKELVALNTSAHTHTDYNAINRITNEKINNWDDVENKVKNYIDNAFLRKDVAEATYVTLSRLSSQLRELSDRISVLEGKMEQTISYIEGTGGEISVSKSGNIATVSFDPNAEFEATLEEE